MNSGDNDNNDGNEDKAGNDVDEVKDGDVGNNGDNTFECTSVNHHGPCGWKIAHLVMGRFIICNHSGRCIVAVQFCMPYASPSLQKSLH